MKRGTLMVVGIQRVVVLKEISGLFLGENLFGAE